MIVLKVTVIVETKYCGVVDLQVSSEEIVELWIAKMLTKLSSLVIKQEGFLLKAALYYKGLEIDRLFKIGEFLNQEDSVTIIFYSQTSSNSTPIQIPKKKYRKRKIKKISKQKKKRRKKHKKNKQKRRKNKNIVICAEPTIQQPQNLIQKPLLLLSQMTLTSSQRLMLNIITFIDDYLLFSANFRKKQFQSLSDIKQYYLYKYGASLEVEVLNFMIKVYPQLYTLHSINNVGIVLKMPRDKMLLQQRKQTFLRSLVEFQNTPVQKRGLKEESKTLAPLQLISKPKIDPISVLYDKQFSQKLEKIVYEKQVKREQEVRKIQKLKINEYRMFLQQIQLFRTLRGTNTKRSTFLQAISKRTGLSQQMVSQFVEFIKKKTEYIKEVFWEGGSKVVVDIKEYSKALEEIQSL